MQAFITGVMATVAVGIPLLAQNVEQGSNTPGRHHPPAIIHERHGHMVTSTNWSGYALTGSRGSVTDVKGSWIVPAVNCSQTPSAYSSLWVGIDGYSSNT